MWEKLMKIPELIMSKNKGRKKNETEDDHGRLSATTMENRANFNTN